MILLVFILLIYLFWIIYIILPLKFRETEKDSSLISVSVIVPVRNEEKNILTILNCLSNQQYNSGSFEVIIVDDHSEDRTIALLNEYISSNNLKHFRYVSSPGEGKKAALNYGISNSTSQLILTTDADCMLPDTWIQSMKNEFAMQNASLVTGMVELETGNTLSGYIQYYEYAAMQICGAGSLLNGHPLLCSGASLAFSRKDFIASGGHDTSILSGDDTFLMLKMHHEFSVKPALDRKAVVIAKGANTVKDFFEQRKRWGSKVMLYRNGYIRNTAVLILMANISFLMALLTMPFSISGLPVLLIKSVADICIFIKAGQIFTRKPVWKALIFIPVYPFFIIPSALLSLKGNYQWKGRVQKG